MSKEKTESKLPKGGKNDNNEMEDTGNEPENDENIELEPEEDKTDIESESDDMEEEPVDVDKDDEPEVQTKEKDDSMSDGEDGETCLYKSKKRNLSKIFESDNLDEELFEDEKVVLAKKIVKPEDRITEPKLFKYERVRLLAERRTQLVNGAKPMIKTNDAISEKDIASLELQHKVIPMIIVRTLPNGNIEHWKLSELEIVN